MWANKKQVAYVLPKTTTPTATTVVTTRVTTLSTTSSLSSTPSLASSASSTLSASSSASSSVSSSSSASSVSSSSSTPSISSTMTTISITTAATTSSCSTFLSQTTYLTGNGSHPCGVAVGDVNNDNKPDIVAANYMTSNVDVLFNIDNGTFLNLTAYSTGSSSHPYSVAAGDLNGDSKPDIVVANFGTNNVGVLLNVGNGTFLNQTTYPAGTSPQAVALADVNGDNKSNIVVVNCNSQNIGVLLNKGNGTFFNQTTYLTGTGSYPFGIAIGDVNVDNKPDIVVANYGTGNVGVMLNVDNVTFSNQNTYFIGTGSDPAAVAIADINNDNKPDIVAANNYLNTVSVFLNAGNGTFLNQTSYPLSAGTNPYAIALTDVNNDNKPDIIVANYGTNNVGVLFHC